MSKPGRYAHFGSKQELHLATEAEAGGILAEEAARAGRAARAGLAQLPAVREAHFDYPSAPPFPAAASSLPRHRR
jgi:AcrR family transcriptional regulator